MGKSKYKEFGSYGRYYYWKGTTGNRWPSGSSNPLDFLLGAKSELLTSFGHPYHLLGKTGRNIGGNFLAIKRDWEGNSLPARHYSQTANPLQMNAYHYFGPHQIGVSSGAWPAPILNSDSVLDALGTTAIANVLPTNPVSGMFVALSELKREGIPSLLGVRAWKDRAHLARSAGDEYLNHQFGWVPLVNDLKDFTYAVKNSDELIRQYERNSGRNIKRTFKWPIDRKVTYTSWNPASTLSPSGDANKHYSAVGSGEDTHTQIIERWFEGCFTYYLPPFKVNGDNSKRNRQLRNYLYGTRVTPEGIWDLTPWSWAADWVGNFGDVLHNVSAFQNDGLVMRYGYMMEKTTHQITRTRRGVKFFSYPGETHGFFSNFTTTVKKRRVATPYGFGLNPDSFSDRQWSILAALGISRGSRQLFD